MSVPVAPCPCQHLALSVFSISAMLTGVWWHFIVGLICNSLVSIFLYLSWLFFDEVSIKVFRPFLNWVVFLLLILKSPLYILDALKDTLPLFHVSGFLCSQEEVGLGRNIFV